MAEYFEQEGSLILNAHSKTWEYFSVKSKKLLTFETWTLSLYPESHYRPEAGCQTAVSLGLSRTKHLPPLGEKEEKWFHKSAESVFLLHSFLAKILIVFCKHHYGKRKTTWRTTLAIDPALYFEILADPRNEEINPYS